MSDDEFEQKLRALTGVLHRPDPTPEWKTDMLARARREADVIPFTRMLPPRWLMFGWAAAWIAILAMNFTTPRETIPGARRNSDTSAANTTAAPAPAPGGEPATLLAFRQRMDLNLEIP